MRNAKELLCLMILISLVGCATSSGPVQVLSYRVGGDPVQSVTPEAGIYRVAVVDHSKGQLAEIAHTRVYLREGAVLGFKLDVDHRLVAVGGEYVLPIELPASGSVSIAWYRTPAAPDMAELPDPPNISLDPNANSKHGWVEVLNDPADPGHKR